VSPSYSSLDAVSSAVYSTLNVASLLALAPGGVGDAIEQTTGFPCVLYVAQEKSVGGLGTRPGTGRTMQVDLRVHVFSNYQGLYEAQQVMSKVVELLTTTLSVAGYTAVPYPFHDDTIPLGNEVVAGVVVRELVSNWRLFVSEVVA